MSSDGRITIDTKIDQKGIDEGLGKMKTKLSGAAGKMKSTGTAMSAGLTVPIVALGVAGLKAASDFSEATRNIKNGLGATTEEAEKLVDVANDIYKRGFGESLNEVSNALVTVKQNFGDLVDEANLGQVTKDALILSKTLGKDVGMVSKAGTTLMKEFGESSSEAFDLIAWGSQNGINYSDEMLDNISEYGPLFSDMGYSADEYFKLLKEGSKEGSYNLDYINDAMKEFGTRVKDGSSRTSDAMAGMSKSTQKVWEDMLAGKATTKEVNDAVLQDLGSMDDKTKASQLGVELYGTKWEDMGSDAVLALGGVSGEIEKADGAMKKISDSQEKSFGKQFISLLRESMDALKPVGEILLDVAKDAFPPLIKAVKAVAKWFSGLSPVMKIAVVVIGAIIAVAGPLLIFFGMIVSAIITLIPVFVAIGGAMMLLLSPIPLIIIGITVLVLLIYRYWETIKAVTITVFTAIWDFLKWVWEGIKTYFTTMFEIYKALFILVFTIIKTVIVTVFTAIWDFIKWVWEGIKSVFTTVVSAIISFVTSRWNNLKSTMSTVFNAIKSVISTVWNTIKSVSSTVWNSITDTIGGIIDGIKSTISTVFNTIKSTISGVWDSIKSTTEDIWEGITGSIKSAINGVISAINGMIGALNGLHINLPTIPDWVPGLGGKGGGSLSFPNIPKIPSLNVGTNFVAQDGLAYLHQGEAVVPKKYNQGEDNNESKRPAIFNLRLGASNFQAFVEDISEFQEKERIKLERSRG